jgi:hypothetical protein
VQQTAAAVEEAAHCHGQVGVGAFQGAVAVVEQATDLEAGFAIGAEGAQLTGLVVEAGGLDRQGSVALDDAQSVVQGAAEIEVDLLPGNLAIVVAAVVKIVASDVDLAFGVETAIAVVEVASGDDRVAALRSDTPAVVVDAAQSGQVQTMGLGDAAAAVVVQVIAVFSAHRSGWP